MLTELPEKIETEAWVQLGDGEEAAYRKGVQRRNLQAMRQAEFGPGSAKLERLREIVEEAAQDGMKVLIFSYFLAALETCEREISVVPCTWAPRRPTRATASWPARPGRDRRAGTGELMAHLVTVDGNAPRIDPAALLAPSAPSPGA